MGTLSELDAELQVIQGTFGRKQPLAQWLNSLLRETDDLVADINCQAYRFLSKAEMLEALEIDENDLRVMGQIATRLQIIATNIDVREAPKFKVIK